MSLLHPCLIAMLVTLAACANHQAPSCQGEVFDINPAAATAAPR